VAELEWIVDTYLLKRSYVIQQPNFLSTLFENFLRLYDTGLKVRKNV